MGIFGGGGSTPSTPTIPAPPPAAAPPTRADPNIAQSGATQKARAAASASESGNNPTGPRGLSQEDEGTGARFTLLGGTR